MNTMIKLIYLSYFFRNLHCSLGITEEDKFLSAIWNNKHGIFINNINDVPHNNAHHAQDAYDFITQYSILEEK